jgi:cytochrome c-type biogenesis protein CcmH
MTVLRARAVWLAACLALSPVLGIALDQTGQLEDPALQARYEQLTHQLRCLVCQNQSVADSDAFLAKDLRNEVREMLTAGKSDAQILDLMTARYGEFVRYSPPLEAKTFLLWGAPFLLLMAGAAVVYRVARKRAAMPIDDVDAPVDRTLAVDNDTFAPAGEPFPDGEAAARRPKDT